MTLERKQFVDKQLDTVLSTTLEEDYKPDLSFVSNFTAKSRSVQYGRTSQDAQDLSQIPYPSPRTGDASTTGEQLRVAAEIVRVSSTMYLLQVLLAYFQAPVAQCNKSYLFIYMITCAL